MTDPLRREETARLARGLAATLGRRLWLGVERAPLPPPAAAAPAELPAVESAVRDASAALPPPASERPDDPAAETRRRAAAAPDLATLAETVAACRACTLCETRTQTVFSDGSARARVMFVGEAPGQHEDERGVPFVGRAGALLTDIIQRGMGIPREEVYIANVLKCRPPENRDPRPEEKTLCTPYLDRQIALVRPEIVITLGTHASQHLLKTTASMGKLRGRVHNMQGFRVLATYHPAFLLRSPEKKKDCWQDIQLAMAELGIARSGAGPAETEPA